MLTYILLTSKKISLKFLTISFYLYNNENSLKMFKNIFWKNRGQIISNLRIFFLEKMFGLKDPTNRYTMIFHGKPYTKT